jgi:DNA-binding HxlR family transcriptional regulator
MRCSIAGTLDAMGDRWAVLILRDLHFGLSKFEEFRHSTGVTNATLSDRLRRLEEQALVERRLYQTSPERYEYVLTRKGRDTRLVILALLQVGDKWQVSGPDGPPVTFASAKTNAPIRLALIDAGTGEKVRTSEVVPKAGPGADDFVRWRLAHLRRAADLSLSSRQSPRRRSPMRFAAKQPRA